MAKVSTNISLDADLKRESQALFVDLGMDLSAAITVFLKQSLRVQGFSFAIVRDSPEIPNAETIAAKIQREIRKYLRTPESPFTV